MPISDLDKLLGIAIYATKTRGIGGTIRETVDDFIVEEVLVDQTKAAAYGDELSLHAIGSSSNNQRFLLCKMVKRNWDTFLAVKNVAKSLKIDQNRVQFAGIKDAKAITAQFITIENISAEEVKKINLKDVQILPIGYVREKIGLFYLLGNHFTITIKQANIKQEKIKEKLNKIEQELLAIGGLPNFYGHQRFGTTRPITHLVGKAISQGYFREAAMLFLANPSIREHTESKAARQELQLTENFKKASENFPKQLRFERQMLSHLAEHPSDFIGAFRKLPPKLLALFVQAHQSYLFNRFLSERVIAGLPLNQAIIGDFVIGVERSGLPLTTISRIVESTNLDKINMQIKAGKLRVGLPIIGLKQKLSQGTMGKIESDVLREEGVEVNNFWINELARVGGKGGLRPIITPIKEFHVLGVDVDKVQLSFMLFRGCYATVFLREVMKPIEPIKAGF